MEKTPLEFVRQFEKVINDHFSFEIIEMLREMENISARKTLIRSPYLNTEDVATLLKSVLLKESPSGEVSRRKEFIAVVLEAYPELAKECFIEFYLVDAYEEFLMKFFPKGVLVGKEETDHFATSLKELKENGFEIDQ